MVKTQERVTMNVTAKSNILLGKLMLAMRAKGEHCFKQDLANAMIEYFHKNPAHMLELLKAQK
jgi:hypothetical protein